MVALGQSLLSEKRALFLCFWFFEKKAKRSLSLNEEKAMKIIAKALLVYTADEKSTFLPEEHWLRLKMSSVIEAMLKTANDLK